MRDMRELIAGCVEPENVSCRSEFAVRFHKAIAAQVVRTCDSYGYLQSDKIDDLIHDTYVRIFDDRCRILREVAVVDEKTIFGFVQSVAFSTVADHFRKKFAVKRGGKQPPVCIDAIEPLVAGSNPVLEYDEALMVRKIRDLLPSITPPPNGERDRRIFELTLEGYTSNEIAQMDGIGLGDKGVQSVILRLKAEIRVKLGEGRREISGRARRKEA